MRTSAYLSWLLAVALVPQQAARAADNGIAVDQAQYANRATLSDFTAADCPDMPRGLEQVKGASTATPAAPAWPCTAAWC